MANLFIVCLDEEGRSVFLDLVRRRQHDAVYFAFDLLWLDGEDLRGFPLIERKRRLRRLIRPSGTDRIIYADHIECRDVDLFQTVCAQDCEGTVAKHKQGIYTTAGLTTWVKIRNPDYTQIRGRHEMFEIQDIHESVTPSFVTSDHIRTLL